MPHSAALFSTLFPGLPRPVYQQESFINLALAHLWLVALSSAIAVVLGVGAGIAVTRPAGREFRPLVETIAAIGQTFPPVAVLAIAVPVMGFGQQPAIIALILYGVLPILQGTLAGIAAVPASVLSVAEGMGMSRGQQLRKVELPLAAPVIITGIRTSVIINIGTATIASTVGANTLGTPIIIGLSGFNTAYIVQGRCWSRWRQSSSIAFLSGWRCTSADTAANNKRISCQHHAANTAYGHQDKKGNNGQFGCLHHLLLLLTEQLYGEAQLLMNH